MIQFVLLGTTHSGNIGAAARAMKTMGVNHLALVSPKNFPDSEAISRASGADDFEDHQFTPLGARRRHCEGKMSLLPQPRRY